MAFTTDNTLITNREMLGELLAAPFRAIGRGLIAMAEAGPRAEAIRTLNATTDAELAACGTTRENEVRRIFGGLMIC